MSGYQESRAAGRHVDGDEVHPDCQCPRCLAFFKANPGAAELYRRPRAEWAGLDPEARRARRAAEQEERAATIRASYAALTDRAAAARQEDEPLLTRGNAGIKHKQTEGLF